MSRDDGFAIADVDVGILEDPKWKRLARAVRDEATIARCFVAYTAAMLGSWADGDRVTVADAAPAWLSDLDDLVGILRNHQLVDDQGRVLEHAFRSWFDPARERRDLNRARWRRNKGAKRGKAAAPGDVPLAPDDPVSADSAESPRGRDADPLRSPRPSVPPGPPVPSRPTGPSESSTRPRGSLERLGSIAARAMATAGPRGGETT